MVMYKVYTTSVQRRGAMSKAVPAEPEKIAVQRSELRQNQSRLLRRAKGSTVLVIRGPSAGDEDKYVLDKKYFDDLLKRNSALSETLEITLDRKLFSQILAAADTLEKDLRSGKLHSFEEAFQEE
jgi:hypothetical protein